MTTVHLKLEESKMVITIQRPTIKTNGKSILKKLEALGAAASYAIHR